MDGANRDERVCAALACVGVFLGVTAVLSGALPAWVLFGAFTFVVGLPLALAGLTRRMMLP